MFITTPCFLLGLIVVCCGTVTITRSPQTVSNATLGGTVRFECRASGTTETPGWNINGQDYRITDLPIGYVYNGTLKSLIVSPVESAMNNSVYYCYFLTHSTSQQRFVIISSSEAVLIIQPSNFIISSSRAVSQHVESSLTASFSVFDSSTVSSITPRISQNEMITSSGVLEPLHPFAMDASSSGSGSYAVSIISQDITVNHTTSTDTECILHFPGSIVAILAAAAGFITLSAIAITALAASIYCHRKKKCSDVCTKVAGKKHSDKTFTECPVYEEIKETNPSLHENPAYEKHFPKKVKLEKNPAYATITSQNPTQQQNPSGHYYDEIMNLCEEPHH